MKHNQDALCSHCLHPRHTGKCLENVEPNVAGGGSSYCCGCEKDKK